MLERGFILKLLHEVIPPRQPGLKGFERSAPALAGALDLALPGGGCLRDLAP